MSPKQLLDLPDEVLNFVAEAVDNLSSLHALACTCTRFQDHAEKFIYRSLTIEHGAQAQALHKAITARPRRAAMASKLTVAPSMVATRGIEHIPSMLEKMNCVKDLFIESPFCNKPGCSEFVEDQERYANIFRKSSLHIVDPSARLLSQLVSCKQHISFTSCHFVYAHGLLQGHVSPFPPPFSSTQLATLSSLYSPYMRDGDVKLPCPVGFSPSHLQHSVAFLSRFTLAEFIAARQQTTFPYSLL
jgi:hypothetical protein